MVVAEQQKTQGKQQSRARSKSSKAGQAAKAGLVATARRAAKAGHTVCATTTAHLKAPEGAAKVIGQAAVACTAVAGAGLQQHQSSLATSRCTNHATIFPAILVAVLLFA